MFADVRRWGNSLAIRIPAEEAEALGLKEGDKVKARLQKVPRGKVDLSGVPMWKDPEGRTDISEKHDELVAEAIEANLERKRRSWKDEDDDEDR